MDFITFFGTSFTVIGVLITVHIARRQNVQMADLQKIGIDTQETTKVTQNTTKVLTEVETKTQDIVIATKDIASALQQTRQLKKI